MEKNSLSPWRDVARPHSDIMEGEFNLTQFAVNIYKVYRGTAPVDYQEPDRFFAKTYLTKSLKRLIISVLRRISGQSAGAQPITNLMTTFGGGKSHALLCLYHLSLGKEASNWVGVSDLLNEADLKSVPKACVAVLSGEDFDPAYGEEGKKGEPSRHTLWGELAWQLGGAKGYELIRKNDELGSAPSAKKIEEILELNDANLILVDEALRFLTRSRVVEVGPEGQKTSLSPQTLEFFRALTEAVSSSSKTALVATLQASILEMAKEDEPDYWRLVEIFKRLAQPVRLAEAEEVYEIIKRRLFEDSGNASEINKTANAYYDYYCSHKDSFPQNVTAPSYLEKLKRAYPFHPELIDVMNERWASIPQFQRTRAILRMLALLIAELYKNDSNPLIQISSAKLSERDFRMEVLQQLHAESQFDSVIESDISGTGARAQKIDTSGNLTYQREHIAECVATSIFFYSFGGPDNRSFALLPDIRLAVLKPGLEPAFIPDAIELLKKTSTGLFYLKTEGNNYYFTVAPNLRAILAAQEVSVEKDKVEATVYEVISSQVSGSRFRTIEFPSEPRDVPEQAQLTLVVMAPFDSIGKNSKQKTAQKILEIIKGGGTYRTLRNCLVFLASEEGNRIAESARTFVALTDVERLYGKARKLSETQQLELNEMLEDSEKALFQSVWQSYRHIITPSPEDKLEFFDMGPQIHKNGKSLSDMVWETLVIREKIAPKIGPSRIMSRDFGLWPENNQVITTKSLRDAFFTYTHLPMIPSIDTLRECITQGVAEGFFAYARGNLENNEFNSIRIGVSIDSSNVEFLEETCLLRPKFAYELLGTLKSVEKTPENEQKNNEKGSKVEPNLPAKGGPEMYESVRISSELDWKKWLEFHEAVLQPLINAGVSVKIRVEVQGTSDQGISPNTVDLAVRESLAQYGIPADIQTKRKPNS